MSHPPIKPTIKQNIPKPLLEGEPAPAAPPPAEASLNATPSGGRKPAAQSTARDEGRSNAARPFRPLYRPPVAILEISDDGSDEGELIRLRGDSITIGRSKAD